MPSSFSGPDTRSDFLRYLLNMATAIKADLKIIVDSVRVLNFCLDLISMNSVLVILEQVCLLLASFEHFLNLDLERTEYYLHYHLGL